ncbi:MAG: hypothetical protein DLM61_01775 [Pseudonocardiales bacterium]|nr:MAG: hypothetical protein DLM61_01775 [Pseudonocardiales bacterium]
MRLHHVYGCTIASDLDLHFPEVDGSLRPEMTLRRSADQVDIDWVPESADLLIDACDEDHRTGCVAALTSHGYRLRYYGLCEFDVSRDLAEVTWKLVAGGDPGLVSVLAAGALLAFRLIMAGHLVLHASAIQARGHSLAFVGASGMGKSTMATLMCAGGATALTDDIARIDFDGARAVLSPGAVESRLRPAAVPLQELFSVPGAIRTTSDGRSAMSLPSWAKGPVSLDAVVVPQRSPDQVELTLTALSPSQALILLGHFPRLLGWVDTGVLAHQFNRLADLVERVPVYLAVVPWGPPFAIETGTQLLDRLGWDDQK